MSRPHARSNFVAMLVVLDVLEAGQLVRERAHVAAALHVVLAAQRIAAAAVAADVAGEQREVDQRQDVVDRVVVLGDAQRPADHRAIGPGVLMRRIANDVGRNARDLLGEVERVRLDGRAIRLEVRRAARDERSVVQTGMNDLARHRVGERDVGADVEPEPHVAPRGGRRAPRIDDVQSRAVLDALEQMVKPDRMRFTGVRSPEEDEVGVLRFLV